MEQGADVAVTNRLFHWFVIAPVFLLSLLSQHLYGAVLPEDRLDVMYFNYDGGGMEIDGPSVLVRKSIGQSVSISAHHLVDAVSGASIDVEMISGASKIDETRDETGITIDYLHNKTILTLSHQVSDENDFNAQATSFNISQDFFGDLTTVSIGYSKGSDTIGMSTSPEFEREANRQNYRLAVTQVVNKHFIMNFSHESITDEGFLNNPYRQVRFLKADDPTSFSLEPEKYPRTRTSRSYALRGKYYLPYRAAVRAEYRTFSDSWGVNAYNYDIGYTHPFDENWTVDVHYRFYNQSAADFYQDIFSRSNQFTFQARDKELSTFENKTIGLGITYEYRIPDAAFLDRGQIHLLYDWIQFDYKDFRDARVSQRQTSVNAGKEPLYSFSASALRLIFSWYF